MTGAVTLRAAGAGEAPALAALHLGTALHAYAGVFPPEAPVPVIEDVEAQWRAWLDPVCGRGTAFVAEHGPELVGVVFAGPDPDLPGTGHLSRLYVAPPWWGRGIGRRLHDAAVAHLAAASFPDATLWVLERNERARTWYERLGWRPTGARKPVYEPAGIVDVGYRRAVP